MHQHKQTVFCWDLLDQVVQLLPQNAFQLGILGTRCWSTRNDESNCLAFTSRREAHIHEQLVNKLVGVPRLTANQLLD